MILGTQLTGQLAGGNIQPYVASLEVGQLKFGTYPLECVNPKNLRDGISFEVFQFNEPRSNGVVFENRNFRQNEFSMSLLISGTSASDFQEKVDDLYEFVHGVYDTLYYKRASGEIRKISCLGKVKTEKEDHYNITWQVFTVTFKTYGEFWYASDLQTFAENFTADGSGFISNNGNVESKIRTYVIINSATSLTSVNLTIGGVSCVYTGSLVANDVLLFDGEVGELYLNGVAVDYSGGTPQHEIAPGSSAFSLDCNGTFDIDIVMIYKKNYKNA